MGSRETGNGVRGTHVISSPTSPVGFVHGLLEVAEVQHDWADVFVCCEAAERCVEMGEQCCAVDEVLVYPSRRVVRNAISWFHCTGASMGENGVEAACHWLLYNEDTAASVQVLSGYGPCTS